MTNIDDTSEKRLELIDRRIRAHQWMLSMQTQTLEQFEIEVYKLAASATGAPLVRLIDDVISHDYSKMREAVVTIYKRAALLKGSK